MKDKHFFAGNNTSLGFYSYFNELLNVEDSKRIYILKGGPGVGKSTFMRKFSSKMKEKGHIVEFVHCSSDNKSMDGIIITDLNISMVDGTAPHTIDPKYPGAVEEIINLGSFLDNKQLELDKDEIILLRKEISGLYSSAYTYLECAGKIKNQIYSLYDKYTDRDEFIKIKYDLVKDIFSNNSSKKVDKSGKIRRLFSEAYTADGYISFTDILCDGKRIWELSNKNIKTSSELLNYIGNNATDRGYDIDYYYNPLYPTLIQHLYIPKLNLFIKSNDSNDSIPCEKSIDLKKLLNVNKIFLYYNDISNNLDLSEIMISNAFEKLNKTKKLHDELEVFYRNSINFKEVDLYFDEILSALI